MAVATVSSPEKISNKDNTKKRTKNCGVRVIGGRIYDSENGKCCHQCRQKTMDFVASCKNLNKSKPCTINFCHKCLLNRYGEKATEMAVLDEWNCPKCRGICNCSFCMKKRGHKPTGILVHTAKATGFSSVSEMLKDTGDAMKKPLTPTKENVVVSPKKLGKENSFDGANDLKVHSPKHDKMKQKKRKREGLKETHDANMLEGLKETCDDKEKDPAGVKNTGPKTVLALKKISKKEGKNNSENLIKEVKEKEKIVASEKIKQQKRKGEGLKETHGGMEKDAAVLENTILEKAIISKRFLKKAVKTKNLEDPMKEEKENEGIAVSEKTDNAETRPKKVLKSQKNSKCTMNIERTEFDADIPLPQGTDLTIVSGVEIPPEDIGDALQFIEFCSAFGKILDVKKGLAECVLREVIHGRGGRSAGRRAQYSFSVQLHMQLLSLILTNKGEKSPSLTPTNGKNSWLETLGKCISESEFVYKKLLPSDCFDRGTVGYDELQSSKKLRLLNFLCDEVLGTEKLRSWIDNQKLKNVEKEKKAKENVTAAKQKEKTMKQKMQDEVAKAIIAKNGAPLSISEHDAVIAQIKQQTAQAHVEMLLAMDMLPKKRRRGDSVRTEPILVDVDGHAYWRLKGCSAESNILLQELGSSDKSVHTERWLVYGDEQKEEIEKYISSRASKRRSQGAPGMARLGTSIANL